jgi:hypothetical protein
MNICPKGHALHDASGDRRWCQGCLAYYPGGERGAAIKVEGVMTTQAKRWLWGCRCIKHSRCAERIADQGRAFDMMFEALKAAAAYGEFMNRHAKTDLGIQSPAPLDLINAAIAKAEETRS